MWKYILLLVIFTACKVIPQESWIVLGRVTSAPVPGDNKDEWLVGVRREGVIVEGMSSHIIWIAQPDTVVYKMKGRHQNYYKLGEFYEFPLR